MRRILLPTGVLAAALLAPAALAAATSSEAAPPRAQLAAVQCHSALDPPARVFAVTAIMRPIAGTQHMQVMFRLLERPRGASTFGSVSASGLGTWIAPQDPSLGQRSGDVWRVVKPVADLEAPASYRFSVSFRWLGARGSVLESVTRTSHVCRQPELRPDLVVERITVKPDPRHSKLDEYRVTIGNRGATRAGPFAVRLTDAGRSKDRTLRYLGAHARRSVVFVDPLCNAADPPYATVDPDDRVDVYTRSRATRAASCPATASAR